MTKYEWWDVIHSLRPELSWDEYEAMWDEFQEHKARRELH